MAKLHEVLAVERDLKGQAEKIRGDLKDLFNKKLHHFSGKITTFKPNVEGQKDMIEEQREVQTTVRKELDWARDFIVKMMDVSLQISEANTGARADVIVNGRAIATAVPATYLLELEKRIGEWKEMAGHIPTLDPTKGFKMETETETFRAHDDIKIRTRKVQKPLVMYEATKEHPAQVQIASYDEPTGELLTQEWSGLITPSEKAAILANIETLARAVKKARARANEIEIKKVKIGRTLFDFAFQTVSAQGEAED